MEIARILCPVDFSECSRRALDQAIAIARWSGARVSALYVHRLSMPILTAAPFVGPEALRPDLLTDSERTDLERALSDWVAEDARAGVPVDTLLDEHVNVSRMIVSRAGALRADLITMGTHGRTGFSRFVLGSVTEKVLRTAGCPVLSVPPLAPDAVPRSPVAYQRIICPIDFSEGSARALEYAAAIAQLAHARLTIVHIIELPPDVGEPPRPDLAEYRAVRFEQARKALQMATAPLQCACEKQELLLAGRPTREILRLANEVQADLIVMDVQGRGAADRLLFGSVTQQVVRAAACPVLTLCVA